MKLFLIRGLSRIRMAFHNAGIEPPQWLRRWGRALFDGLGGPEAAAAAQPSPAAGGSVDQKLDHIIWRLEKIEAMLYLQQIQGVSTAAARDEAAKPDGPSAS